MNAYAWMLIGQRMKDRVDPQFQPEPKQAHAAEKVQHMYSTQMSFGQIAAAEDVARKWLDSHLFSK